MKMGMGRALLLSTLLGAWGCAGGDCAEGSSDCNVIKVDAGVSPAEDRPADADRILYEGMILSLDPERAHVQAVFDAFPPRACDLHVPSGDQP